MENVIKINHLKLRVPPEFQGRESELLQAIGLNLASNEIPARGRIEALGPLTITASRGQGLVETGRQVAEGIKAGLSKGRRVGHD